MNTLYLHIERQKTGRKTRWIQQLLVDKEIINTRYMVNYLQLARSAVSTGKYWVLTCGCGEPGHAGLGEPIGVIHSGTTITWHIVEPEPERFYSFDAAQYRQSIFSALTYAQKTITRHPVNLPIGPNGFKLKDLDLAILFAANTPPVTTNVFYFTTTKEKGEAILSKGFASDGDYYRRHPGLEGVEVSNEMNHYGRFNFVIEIAIDAPIGSLDRHELQVTDHYDRVFLLPLPVINSGRCRLVSQEELKKWANATKHRPPIP